jgi:predicted metal-binding membrane protein
MTGMGPPPHPWYGAAARHLGMWIAMMVPMMLPSLIPMLSRYRRSMHGTGGIHPLGLTALVTAGYYSIWAVLGVAAYAAGAGLGALEMRWTAVAEWRPLAAGAVLVLAGGVQCTSWKARQLARCRDWPGCGAAPPADALRAWRHGLELGIVCSRGCGSLMLALLAIGMMNPLAVAAVTIAISAERLAPDPVWVARVAGMAIVGLGALGLAWT